MSALNCPSIDDISNSQCCISTDSISVSVCIIVYFVLMLCGAKRILASMLINVLRNVEYSKYAFNQGCGVGMSNFRHLIFNCLARTVISQIGRLFFLKKSKARSKHVQKCSNHLNYLFKTFLTMIKKI